MQRGHMKKVMNTGSFGSEAEKTKVLYGKSPLKPIRGNRLPEAELSSAARELVDLLVEVTLRTQVDSMKFEQKRSSSK